ncbi:hypothetical protein [Streptomyces sp. NPDC018610]|uniref:hypothetical protein n=1 Tax=Streptomyces sp. NPDC018610 TaxID=3365049 RepID=UPI0037910B53
MTNSQVHRYQAFGKGYLTDVRAGQHPGSGAVLVTCRTAVLTCAVNLVALHG